MLFRRKTWLILVIGLFSIVTAGAIYEQTAQSHALNKYQPKGTLIDVGNRNIHLDCRGEGSPIVILESGLDTLGSLSWSAVHDELATTTRTCAYDRAGIMWSEPRADTDNLMQAITKDLEQTLTLAGEKPPYVLVGHSFGGPYITYFTAKYPDKVNGIVFVDSPHPEQMDLVEDIVPPLTTAFTDKLQNLMQPILNKLGVTRLASSTINFPNLSKYNSNAATEFYPSSQQTLATEIENYSIGLKQVDALRDFGNRPMFVLGNIVNYPEMSDQQLANAGLTREIVPAVMKQDLYMFNNQASWSSNSDIKLFHNTSHYIQFEKPNKVIRAIETVVNKVRLAKSERH